MSCNLTGVAVLESCGNQDANSLISYWCNNNCFNAYYNYLNSDNINGNFIFAYNKDQLPFISENVNSLFSNYLKTYDLTNDVNSIRYNSFQNTLLSLCLDPSLPGVCDQFLQSYCSNYSRNETIGNDVLTNFCGCYVPSDQNYLQYTNNAACDPLCHRTMTVKKPDGTGGNLTCAENICVINDISINTANSSLTGRANIVNICPYCPNGCLCIVSGVNVNNTLSQVGLGTNIEQYCGKNSVCLVEDSNGNVISSGPCDNSTDIDFTFSSTPAWSTILIFAFCFLLLILICFLI